MSQPSRKREPVTFRKDAQAATITMRTYRLGWKDPSFEEERYNPVTVDRVHSGRGGVPFELPSNTGQERAGAPDTQV